jgi:hypothetical protein
VCIVSSSWKTFARRLLLLALLTIVNGCVSSRAFVPTEHVSAFSPRGNHYAAEYPILETGQTVGEVKLWATGASRDGSDDEPRTTVTIGFQVSSHGQTPLRFDAERLYLEETVKKGEPAGRLRPTRVEGETLVPPGQSRQLEASFTLPSSVWPSDVPGFRVAWNVVGRQRHSRKTPFLKAIDRGSLDPWYPSYSPYYGSYYPGFYGSWSYRYRGWPPPWRMRRFYGY